MSTPITIIPEDAGLPAVCSDDCEQPVTYTEREVSGAPFIWFSCACSEGPYAPL